MPLQILVPSGYRHDDNGVPSRSRLPTSQLTPEAEAALALKDLPKKLVEVAKQPIVKGAGLGPGYLVGNIRSVVTARRAVYARIQGLPVPDDWEAVIKVDRLVKKTTFPLFLCPFCASAI
ncbi:hypothetical protein HGRIS_012502 [Hohenbuehelia grisea]|uniref:Uncharacterized protein n=1 Tax=Hohenbuehelia grisea TaxID=104357 RepID=A0ABR3ISN6_9AGAR